MDSDSRSPAFNHVSDLQLMQLQELLARNFDYSEQPNTLLEVFNRIDAELSARGNLITAKHTSTSKQRRAA